MTIESGNIYNILRTYNRQVKFGKATDALSSKKSSSSSVDKVSLSPEAKKLMFITDILGEIGRDDVKKEDIEKYLKDVDFAKINSDDLEKLKKDILASFA
ncbi:hypothetical protein FHQ18_05690 [Deferribacter autotrophicus]|uniref:Uncharacterized protein n=1 Tax=Deferribacter autotrophicus TaxID=500465 RepID=A0A5A8F430_9BACT|nr:hypothetical protein [Deferribacter autotrophicus]KAA0258648.1 hypothetical protein FHQ18_05690 [Deferribacter autotrophicus]